MAITATVDKFGMTFTDAYHRISSLQYESADRMQLVFSEDPEDMGTPTWVKITTARFKVDTYASQEVRDNHNAPIYSTEYNTVVDLSEGEPDLITQAYDHLKAQEDFDDAIDC